MDVFLDTSAPDGTANWHCLDWNASCDAPQCTNACSALAANDTKCRDGGKGSVLPSICEYGTNCAACGVRKNTRTIVGDDTCESANNGVCEDGATGSGFITETEFNYPGGISNACGLGEDNADCAQYGERTQPVACDTPVALPYNDTQREYADVGPLICNQVTYPREDGELPSRFNSTYSATLSFRMYNRAGNLFMSAAPYRAIIRVYANNGNQTFDSGYVTALGDEAEYSEDIVHTFYNLTLGRGDPFTVRLMHIARETQDYWPDISVQFSGIVVSVHEPLRTPEHIDGNFG